MFCVSIGSREQCRRCGVCSLVFGRKSCSAIATSLPSFGHHVNDDPRYRRVRETGRGDISRSDLQGWEGGAWPTSRPQFRLNTFPGSRAVSYLSRQESLLQSSFYHGPMADPLSIIGQVMCRSVSSLSELTLRSL